MERIISLFYEMMDETNIKLSDLVKTKRSQEMLNQYIIDIKENISDMLKKEIKKLTTTRPSIKKLKKEIDGEPPKKPLSAYIIFCKENRDSIISNHPGVMPTEIMCILGAEWRRLTDKSYYYKKADELKDEYKVKFEKWKIECKT